MTLAELLPERSRMTLVKDQPGCLGLFVLLDQLKRAQSVQHPVTIFAIEHSKEHWMACAKKLGSPLSAATAFIDGLGQLADADENTLKNLLEQITQSLRNSSRPDTPSKFLIDDLACLSWLGFTDREVDGFIKGLLSVAEEIDVDVVAIVHSPHNSTLLEAFSTLTIVTEPLSTGASAEVTGQIKAYRGPLWDSEASDSKDSSWTGWEKQLHLTDSSIQVFAKGLGRSVI